MLDPPKTYLISDMRNPEMRFKNGVSHAKNLITFIPPKSSCSSFARLSVHCMVLRRILNSDFMMLICTGVMKMKNAKPASALGPSR